MAITEVASQVFSDKSTVSELSHNAAFPSNVTLGNLVIIGGAGWGNENSDGIGTVTVTKEGSSTCTLDTITTIYTITPVAYSTGFMKSFLACAPVTGTGSLTFTVSWTHGGYINLATDEFTGVHTSPLDVDGGDANILSTTTPTDTITTLVANDLIIGCAGWNNGITVNPGSGYTQIYEDETGDAQQTSVIYKVVTTATTYNVDWSGSSAVDWVIVNAAFKAAIPAAPIMDKHLPQMAPIWAQ